MINDELQDVNESASVETPENDQTDDLFVPDHVLMPIVESLIFASETPITIGSIKTILDENQEEFGTFITAGRIVEVIQRLNQKYEQQQSSFYIRHIADGFAFMTKEHMAEWISKLYREKAPKRLSQSSLETLSIISYKQPISKPEVESIRGVSCDYPVKILLEKNLIKIVGRAETVGKPLLYGTTTEFLEYFGLATITDLPKPREISEIIKDEDFEFDQQMKIRMESSEQMNEAQGEEPEKVDAE